MFYFHVFVSLYVLQIHLFIVNISILNLWHCDVADGFLMFTDVRLSKTNLGNVLMLILTASGL